MKTFRKVIFWMHLISGATAGVVIFIMCVTGALLSFERQIIEFAEGDLKEVNSTGAAAVTPQAVLETVREARPDAKPSAISKTNDPNSYWAVNLGREGLLYVQPYSGRMLVSGNKSTRNMMS